MANIADANWQLTQIDRASVWAKRKLSVGSLQTAEWDQTALGTSFVTVFLLVSTSGRPSDFFSIGPPAAALFRRWFVSLPYGDSPTRQVGFLDFWIAKLCFQVGLRPTLKSI